MHAWSQEPNVRRKPSPTPLSAYDVHMMRLPIYWAAVCRPRNDARYDLEQHYYEDNAKEYNKLRTEGKQHYKALRELPSHDDWYCEFSWHALLHSSFHATCSPPNFGLCASVSVLMCLCTMHAWYSVFATGLCV